MAYTPAGTAAVGAASVRRKPSPPIDHRSGVLPWWSRGCAFVEQPNIVKLRNSSSRDQASLREIRWYEPSSQQHLSTP